MSSRLVMSASLLVFLGLPYESWSRNRRIGDHNSYGSEKGVGQFLPKVGLWAGPSVMCTLCWSV